MIPIIGKKKKKNQSKFAAEAEMKANLVEYEKTLFKLRNEFEIPNGIKVTPALVKQQTDVSTETTKAILTFQKVDEDTTNKWKTEINELKLKHASKNGNTSPLPESNGSESKEETQEEK